MYQKLCVKFFCSCISVQHSFFIKTVDCFLWTLAGIIYEWDWIILNKKNENEILFVMLSSSVDYCLLNMPNNVLFAMIFNISFVSLLGMRILNKKKKKMHLACNAASNLYNSLLLGGSLYNNLLAQKKQKKIK